MKQIKICGLSREEDIREINKFRPDFAGFIINFPKSHRNVSPEKLETLSRQLSKEIKAVGVTVDQPIELLADLIGRQIIDIAQLHGKENNDYIRKLKGLIPAGTPVWQAIQIKSPEDVIRANESEADFVILDAGQGAGVTFDWSVLDDIHREFGLAGGINLDNIGQALKTKAVLIDVSGGVETDKLKDSSKIENMIAFVRKNTAKKDR